MLYVPNTAAAAHLVHHQPTHTMGNSGKKLRMLDQNNISVITANYKIIVVVLIIVFSELSGWF